MSVNPNAGPAGVRVSLVVEVGKRLAVLADAHDPLGRRFSDQVMMRLETTSRRLGIAPVPDIAVRADAGEEAVRIRLNGRIRRCPEGAARAVGEHFLRDEPGSPLAASDWWQELTGYVAGVGADAKRATAAVDALAALAARICQQAPEELVGVDQVAQFLDSPAAEGAVTALPADRVAAILRAAVGLGASVGDRSRAVKIITDGLRDGVVDEDTAETVVSRLRTRRITIEASADYLEQILHVVVERDVAVHDPAVPSTVRERFTMMADGLFYELGIRIADIRLAAVDDLTGYRVRIAIGDFAPFMHIGLPPARLLVAETAETLSKAGVAASPAVNPASGRPCAIVAIGDSVAAGTAYTWNAAEYLVLLTAGELRRQAHLSIDVGSVELELASLHEAFPALVMATLERISVGYLARVMRLLLREEVSIRNLRTVLESLLSANLIDAANRKDLVDDAAHGLATVRMELQRYLVREYDRGSGTLTVYLLDSALEREVQALVTAERGPTDRDITLDVQRERIRAAVRAAVGSSGSNHPIVLTTGTIRLSLRHLMVDERPDLAVLAYEELTPDVNVLVLASISLAS